MRNRPDGVETTSFRGDDGKTFVELVAPGWWNHLIASFDEATLDNFSDETSTIEERFFETPCLAGEFRRAFARIAVLHATKAGFSDRELSTDEPHELDAHRNDVAPAFDILVATSFEEETIDESHRPPALVSLVERSFAS